MEEDPNTLKYTVVPIINPEHRERLDRYVNSDNDYNKRSYCRFYLRGLCIMKPQFCKFAHSFDELRIEEEDKSKIQYFTSDKERRKKQFLQKQDFNQKALFLLKNIDFIGLYDYQFSQRFKKANESIRTLEQLRELRQFRHRIREVLHRQEWTKLLRYLQENYPAIDYTVSFLSYWFQKVGFSKPQTRCKFGDFMRYLIFVEQYKEVQIVMPPRVNSMLFFISKQRQETYLAQNLQALCEIMEKERQEQRQRQQGASKQLPPQLYKKYICRYYMAGNCAKSAEACFYAHRIKDLRYVKGQTFPAQCRQPSKSLDFRLVYTQVINYSKSKGYPHTVDDFNSNPGLRNQIRNEMHLQIYKDFIELLQKQWNLQHIPLSFLEKEYHNAGFNHSVQNKFRQFKDSLWDVGYYVDEVISSKDAKNKKTVYVYRIPEEKTLDQYYRVNIKLAITKELNRLESDNSNSDQKGGQILESTIRRNIYMQHKDFTLPMHVYLSLKNCTLQQLIQNWFSQLVPRIFFETGAENMKKLNELVKKYLKENKKYIHKLETIESYIKNQHEKTINLNSFINFRQCLQQVILECGKRVYFWSFGQNTIVVDKGCFGMQQKTEGEAVKRQKKSVIQKLQIPKTDEKFLALMEQRLIVVNNEATFDYARRVMMSSNVYGVDLEGKLSQTGKIDLIQFSVKTEYSLLQTGQTKQKKQILIFDLYLLEKDALTKEEAHQQLHQNTKEFLKFIFQDESRVKILHDCRQDTVALHYLLGATLKNVFDTSGMYIYLEQKSIYAKGKELKPGQLLRQIHEVRIPGLNAVLDKWEAPNGINIFKEDMKKKFGSEKRVYFEKRPIDPQFLQYSAQDVEDLIQVYEKMKSEDSDLLSRYIGEIYSKVSTEGEKQLEAHLEQQIELGQEDSGV